MLGLWTHRWIDDGFLCVLWLLALCSLCYSIGVCPDILGGVAYRGSVPMLAVTKALAS